MIRAQRRDKHIRNATHSSKNRKLVLVLWANRTTEDLSWKSLTEKIPELICVFSERISKGSSFQNLGAATEKALLTTAALTRGTFIGSISLERSVRTFRDG